jgi:hypothetical protein
MLQKLKKRLQNALGVSALSEKMDKLSIEARIAAGFSRGAAGIAAQTIDPTSPQSWEFGAFSQHGEDGILDHLIRNLKVCDKYFLEIAAGDGLENCTAYLALGAKWSGVMVEGDAALAEHCRRVYQNRIWNVMVSGGYVDLGNISEVLNMMPMKNFDLFSLDIDSIDFHIMKAVLELGYRPKIIVVEYNSAFGPTRAVTVPYQAVFNRWSEHPSGVYYGASVMAWRSLLESLDYHFVSVDSSGTNAFFANCRYFDEQFLSSMTPIDFIENASDVNPTTVETAIEGGGKRFSVPSWERQSQILEGMDLDIVEVDLSKKIS